MINKKQIKYLVCVEFQTNEPIIKFVMAENKKDAIAIFQDLVCGVNNMNDDTYDHFMSEAKFSVETKEETGEKYWEFAVENYEMIKGK